MERVGQTLAETEFGHDQIELVSIGITYMSVGKKQIDVEASVLSKDPDTDQLRMTVQILQGNTDITDKKKKSKTGGTEKKKKKKKKILSEGTLVWRPVMTA